ncbi:hypothetical protein PIB30_095228, partial [Stylosanthes scabra]|nr:hypothetical protein [Stylosanthes scabra]
MAYTSKQKILSRNVPDKENSNVGVKLYEQTSNQAILSDLTNKFGSNDDRSVQGHTQRINFPT